MFTRKIVVTMLLLLLVPALGLAQLKNQQKNVDLPTALRTPPATGEGKFSILGLDPAKFDMRHSYSLMYFSYGGRGFSQGLYLNTMTYRFSDPLTMRLQWGMVHQPFNALGKDSPLKSGLFLSGAELDYRPADNLWLRFQYRALPSRAYNPYRYWYGLDDE